MCPEEDNFEMAQDAMLDCEKYCNNKGYLVNNNIKTAKRSASRKLEKLYKVGEILGKGGFGTVYAGVSRKDGKCVAIKHIAKAKIVAMDMVSA